MRIELAPYVQGTRCRLTVSRKWQSIPMFDPSAIHLAGPSAALASPPILCLGIAFLGALLIRYRLGGPILWLGLLGLLGMSTPLGSRYLISSLEIAQAPPRTGSATPGAIVVLGGDVYETRGRDGNGFEVGKLTLERERTAVRLHRATGLPILVTGGPGDALEPAVGDLMGKSLREDWQVAPTWIERRSFDTWENATLSAPILRSARIHTVYVVTQAWHMPRALIAFRNAGFDAVPAPVPAGRLPSATFNSLVPKAAAWGDSANALHEWIGCLWYSWRIAHDRPGTFERLPPESEAG